MDARQASPSEQKKSDSRRAGPHLRKCPLLSRGPPAAEMDVRRSMSYCRYPHLCKNLPTGKSLLIFRNRVKPFAQKYSAFHVGQINGIKEFESRSTELGAKAYYRDWKMTSATCIIR